MEGVGGREGGREIDVCCSVRVFEWWNMLPLSPASPWRAWSTAWNSMHAHPWRSSDIHTHMVRRTHAHTYTRTHTHTHTHTHAHAHAHAHTV
jgi:hypothetical protein